MKTIVITGSTRGIGYGLAAEFLKRGCAVCVSGRTAEAVQQAVASLAAQHGAERVHGQPCDVTVHEQVQALWDAAQARFGRVDIWINNAGISHARTPFWEHPPQTLKNVVDTNTLGVMYGSRVALRGMVAQGGGHLYNMEGLGSDGRMLPGMGLYGSTKYALRYFSKALTQEAQGAPVKVSTLSPGMVVTDLLTGEYHDPKEWARAKRIFNILADRVETVTPWLVDKVLANEQSGAHIAWLTPGKVAWRFASARFSKRDLFKQ